MYSIVCMCACVGGVEMERRIAGQPSLWRESRATGAGRRSILRRMIPIQGATKHGRSTMRSIDAPRRRASCGQWAPCRGAAAAAVGFAANGFRIGLLAWRDPAYLPAVREMAVINAPLFCLLPSLALALSLYVQSIRVMTAFDLNIVPRTKKPFCRIVQT